MTENICRKFRLDTQKLHGWFFYAFLVLSTLSIRKIMASYHLAGAFNEYSSVYVYVSDFFLLLAMFFWGISSLCNKNKIMSSKRTDEIIVPRATNCSTWNNLFFWFNSTKRKIIFFYSQVVHNKVILIFAIATFLFLTTTVRVKSPIIAIYSFIRIIEMLLVVFYFIKNVPRGTFFRNFLWITLMLGVANSLIGIGQFIFQHSLGLDFIKESFISPEHIGVAKLVFNEKQVIRAYGLFPHPNIFGGYLLFSICCTIIYYKLFLLPKIQTRALKRLLNFNSYKLFHVEQLGGYPLQLDVKKSLNIKKTYFWGKIVDNALLISKIFNKKTKNTEILAKIVGKIIPLAQKTAVAVRKISKSWFSAIVPRGTILLKFFILIQIIALFLTFSKSAILAFAIALGYALIKNVSRGTFFRGKDMNNKMFHVEHFVYIALLSLVGILFCCVFFKPDFETFFLKSLYERSLYQDYALALISSNFWFGVGLGQFVLNLASSLNLPAWQLQPVHNVFLLIFSENGVIGFSLFSIVIIFLGNVLIKNVPRGTFNQNVFKKEEKNDAFGIQKKNVHFKEKWIFCINLVGGLFMGFIVIMLFDHYLWDIHQGKILLSIFIGLALFFSYSNELIDAERE